MEKIDKKYFLKNIENLLTNNNIPSITNDSIKEFLIGKNYVYSIENNTVLIKIQRWLNKYFQENIPLNNSAIAFRKNLSYLHLFEPHRMNYHFLRLDIKSFFHSINTSDIQNIFEVYFEDDYIDERKEQALIDVFMNLVTYTIPEDSPNEKFRGKKVLPMGFITSPVVSNIIFRKLDIQIQEFCSVRNITYTRYADDMLFSSGKNMGYVHSDNFIGEISILLSQMNFKLNKNKTIKAKHTISLNGYTIQYSKFQNTIVTEERIINELRLSNKKIDIIKKMIHMINKENIPSSMILKKLFNYKLNPSKFKFPVANQHKINNYYEDQLLNRLTGYRSYLLSVVNFEKKYTCCQESTIRKYIELIDSLNMIIEKHNNT